VNQQLFSATATLPPVDPRQLAETSIALWLTNSNMTNPTLEDIMNFSSATTFEEARTAIFKKLAELGLDTVFSTIEKPLIDVVSRMNEHGIVINADVLKVLSKKHHITLDALEKKIWKLAGEEFNVSSPKQLGTVLFEKLALKVARQKKTASGAYSTKESELEKLREVHPIIAPILDYRELAKLLGTYIDTLPEMAGKDGRIHAQFLQAGTTTGRMGCENPNLQNIPNKTDMGREIRQAFVAPKGFKLVAFDYSQIELRIAAFLSGDSKLIEIFKKGEDVHTAVASEVFGVPTDRVHADMRRKAKVINFGVMYGMGVNALRSNLGEGTTREEAQTFYNEYFEKFSGLALYLDEVKNDARKKGFTETFFGRRRYFPGMSSKLPFIRASAERMAINAPIQGTEADIIKLAMVHANTLIEQKGFRDTAHLLLQVHDELVYEVVTDKVDSFVSAMKPIMEGVVDPQATKGVVCTVDAKVGDNWGEMKPVRN
ncbi:MAG: DNA polymerase, partial [Candidatus Taylorbacteria bacterium]|nr:DNA polymerase [Candidatus Taylorbacteria bacterium]